jgi:hypothetical protein
MKLILPKCRRLIALLTLLIASTTRAGELPWGKFNDPKANFYQGDLVAAIVKLPEHDKKIAVARLRVALTSPEIEVRRRAALALGDLGDKSGVPVMIRDLATPDLRHRQNIVVALRILKDKRAIPALRGALKDKSPYVRGIALAALGEVKAVDAFADIVAHLRDRQEQEYVCMPSAPAHLAIYALGALGDKKAIPVLMTLLDVKGLGNEYYTPIAQALGTLTGEKFGYDIEKWRAWWKAHQRGK